MNDTEGVALQFEQVTVRYRRRVVLDALDWSVPTRRVTVLLGANGSGKSTLLRLCIGAQHARAGRVRVLGFDPVTQRDAVLRSVGYVPDRADAPGSWTLEELLRFARAHHATWDDARAESWIDALRVPRRAKLRTMSKGESTKAMLVVATAFRPRLLLLDEPFGGLDPHAREDVLRALLNDLAEDGTGIVCSTHELDFARRFADDVAVLARGRITVGAVESEAGEGEGDGDGDGANGNPLRAAFDRAQRQEVHA